MPSEEPSAVDGIGACGVIVYLVPALLALFLISFALNFGLPVCLFVFVIPDKKRHPRSSYSLALGSSARVLWKSFLTVTDLREQQPYQVE